MPASGKNDFVFAAQGAAAHREDAPHAEVHLVYAAPFVPETHAKPIAPRICAFAIAARRGF